MYAVLFDIDGTLILTGGSGQVAFSQTFAEDFGVAELSGEVAFAGRSDRVITLDLMEAAGVEPSEGNWQKFQLGYLKRLPATLEELPGRVLPGVFELLDLLAAMPDVVVGLLTGNTLAGAQEKLTYYGLWDRFAFGGFGDHQTNRDHIAAEAVQAAQDYLGVSQPAAKPLCGAMVLGDTVHDITCARSVGAFAIGLPTGHTTAQELSSVEPDLLLNDLTDTKPIIAAIEASLQGDRQFSPTLKKVSLS